MLCIWTAIKALWLQTILGLIEGLLMARVWDPVPETVCERCQCITIAFDPSDHIDGFDPVENAKIIISELEKKIPSVELKLEIRWLVLMMDLAMLMEANRKHKAC